jgi:hypothetical protein
MFADIRRFVALGVLDDGKGFCDIDGANCSVSATGFGTVHVADTYGTGADRTFFFNT